MTIDWEESWLLLKNEWVGHDLEPTTCNTQGYYEITTSDVVVGSDHAMIELLASTCFSGFKITNKANAEKIIINLQDHDVKFSYNLQIEGNKANVTIIGTKEILFKDVITENINKLTYINGLYQGIDPHTNKIQFNHGNNGVWINNLKCQTIGLSSSKVVLAGNIEVDAYILIKLEGTGADGYKLDTQKLLSLSTNILKIVDNKSGHGINLCGNISANEIIIEPGNYLLLSKGQLIAQTILIAAHPTIDTQGNVDIASSLKATEIQIRVNNLRVQNTGEIKTVDFQIDANTIKAKAIRIITKESFLMDGLVIAKNDSIFYHAESFSSSGISVSLSHLRLTAKHSIQIDAANPEVIKRWQAGLSHPGEESIANLLSLSGGIFLNATNILLNKGAQIVNIGKKIIDNISGRIAITASSYIYHDANIIIANSNIVEEANGQNTEGFGVILENNAQIISISGYVKITTQANTKLGGTFIGSEGIFLYTACLHTTPQSLILSEHANTKIKITNCEFFNYGSIGSNKLLDITVTGGHFENHNLLVGAEQIELIVHDRKDFTSYGQIHSGGDARFGLWAGASVIFKPGSFTQVGSYHIEHFSGDVSLNIGIVDCHGCEIITTTNADSVIRATMFVARLTHYQKLPTEQVAEKTFLYAQSQPWLKHTIDHYTTVKIYQERHEGSGPAIIKHSGNLELDVNMVTIFTSELGAEGSINFKYPDVNIISPSVKRWFDISPDHVTWINRFDHVKNEFGLAQGNVVIADLQPHYHVFQYANTLNSIIYAKKGFVGQTANINLDALANNAATAALIITKQRPMISGINSNNFNIENTRALLLMNWQDGISHTETITPQYLQKHGFDLTKLINPKVVNPKVWSNVFEQATLPAVTSDDSLQPIFFLKSDSRLANFIQEPLSMAHFLADLAFTTKGLVYVIGDGHFVKKLVNEAVFSLLGILAGGDSSKLLNSLALNAISEQKLQPDLAVGNELSLAQINALESTIIWPVWLNNCVSNERCLTFKLYFNEQALVKSLVGAIIATENTIDLTVLGDVLIGLGGQINGQVIKFDLQQGNFVNLGTISSSVSTYISADNIGNAGKINVEAGDLSLNAVYDIVNLGSTQVKAGNLYLNAGHDITELTLINPLHPVPELTKRAIYTIGGNLYYKAEHDITQQASVIFASGDIVMNAGHNIVIESVHHSRVVKTEHSRKHYLIQSTIDQYDAVIMVDGTIEMTAGNNFIGSGVKLASSTGDIEINAGKRAVIEDKTGYAWNHQSATKSKFLGKSKVSVSWTTDKTAQVEIAAPGGTVYISSKECSLEGGRIDGKIPVFKCDKLLIKAHEVTKRIKTTSSKSGLMAPKIPVIDLASSEHPEQHLRDNTIAGQINALINMQGPLDLLPAVNVISAIPGLKADYNFLKGNQTTFSPAALVGALLSKYISASISIGYQKSSTAVTQTTNSLSQITGEQCSFSGEDLDIAANINCQDSLEIKANNLKLSGSKDTLQIDSTTKSSGVDVGVGLSGVSFAVSFAGGNAQQTGDQHQTGTYHATNISIKVNNKLEIENAQINGKDVEVEALIIEINQVIDSSRSKNQNSGISMGVNIDWSGVLTPITSLSRSEGLQQTQVVQLISSISGETVEVTAKSLAYNIAAITATQDLEIKADNINYMTLPHTENIDTATQVAASITPRTDGKSIYYGSLYSKDGDKVMSIGWSSDLLEGIEDIRDGIKLLSEVNNDEQKSKPSKKEDNTKKEQESDQRKSESEADQEPKEKRSSAKITKGQTIYDAPIGPNEPFIDDYKKVEARIDKMPISDAKKLAYKEDAYKVIKALYSISSKEQANLANQIENQDRDKNVLEKIWQETKKINPLWSDESQALAPIVIAGVTVTPELLLGLGALIGVTYEVFTNAIEKTSEFLKQESDKAKILSTPIHENKGTIHSTPAHENKGDVETFPIYENKGQKLITIPEENGHFKKPEDIGFPIHDGDLHIIFEYKIDGKKFQDHHIISDKNKHTEDVIIKKLWEKAGMNPQSRANKIFLPTEPEHHPTRSIHKGKHWDSVSEELADNMDKILKLGESKSWTQQEYKNALEKILQKERADLRSGERVLNKNMREWADDKGRK